MRGRRGKWLAALVGAALSGLIVSIGDPPGSAAVAPGEPLWSPRTILSAQGVDARSPGVAIDGRGDVTVVWAFTDRIQAVRRTADQPWGTPVTIGRGFSPRVGTDARGNVTVVWRSANASPSRLMSARRPAGGPWKQAVTIARRVDFSYNLAVSKAGRVVATWVRRVGGRLDEEIWSSYRPVGRRWRSPEFVAATESAGSEPEVAIDGQGNAVTAFSIQHRIAVVRRVVGRGWLRPVLLTSGRIQDFDGFPDIAANRAGDIVVAWMHIQDVDSDRTLQWLAAVRRPARGPWEAPVKVAADAVDIRVGIDRSGAANAAWARDGSIEAARRALAEPWQPPATVEGPESTFATELQLATNGRGDALVTWVRAFDFDVPPFTERFEIRTAYGFSGGSWSAPQTLGAVSSSAELALNGAGDGAVVWTTPGDGTRHTRVVARLMSVPGP